MTENGRYSTRTVQVRFGSWNRAVEAAGFHPRPSGEDYLERPTHCKLCGAQESGLDFHHWRYGENEAGCYLCRACHDYVHQGPAKVENPDWLVHCVEQLVERHVELNGPSEPREILERYRMTDVSDLVERTLDAHVST